MFLYRYNTLLSHNYLSFAQEEKENIENVVLKGGISTTCYIWRSEHGENTCDVCADLDGKIFDYYDEVPEPPHPNCKCTVEVLEDEEDKPQDEQHDEDEHEKSDASWIMPCKGPIVGKYLEKRPGHIHNGIDIKVPVGTPIKAVADGIVVITGPASGYGYWVGINHGLVKGVQVSSEYGHLSKWTVNKGQKVIQGQVIGYSGNTGHSDGPHCHLTIREGVYKGQYVDPYKYIKSD